MGHLLTLLLILTLLIVYSNLFTLGYLIFLRKCKTKIEDDLKLFLAFALSIATIFLLLIFPKFPFNNFHISLVFFAVGLTLSISYVLVNKNLIKPIWHEIKEVCHSHKGLFVIWLLAIFIMIIPALHYPWYFGYGIDWVNHIDLVRVTIMGNADTFYPALGVHAFFSIMDLLQLPQPELWQIGVAYLLSLSLFPLYFITRWLVDAKTTIIALMLWAVLPYHHFMYGEYIPNAAVTFFFLSFFLVIFSLLKNRISNREADTNLWIVAGGLFLAVAAYIHQAFFYPFFLIFTLLSILFVFFFRKNNVVWLLKTYAKIMTLTVVLTLPFLHKFYSGINAVLVHQKSEPVAYYFSDVVNTIRGNIGFIVFFAGISGVVLYVMKCYHDKQKEGRLKIAILLSLIFGVLAAINIYFDQNPFWSQRSLYLLATFLVIPVAYFVTFLSGSFKGKGIPVFFILVFAFIVSAKIDYAMSIDPLWSKEIQTSVEWMVKNKSVIKDKEVFLVFGDPAGANRVFWLSANVMAGFPIKIVTKGEFSGRPVEQDREIVNNAFYRIVENGNALYFDYKVGVLESFDSLNFVQKLQAKPERTYVLDKILRRHFFALTIDQESMKISGNGLPIDKNRRVGQKFTATTNFLYEVCVNLSKNDAEKADPIYLKLYEDVTDERLATVMLPERQTELIPLNVYQEFCFKVKEKTIPGATYVFYIISKTPTQYYGVLNAGKEAYPFGTAYMNSDSVADNLLFKTKTLDYFSW